MTAQEAYILAKAYTKKSIEGAGSLKGSACQIKSIEEITGGHRITFEWENNDGEVSTDTMDVMDGADGNDGVGISSITYKETDAHGNYVYTVTLTDTNTYDIICPKGAQGETGATGATGNGIASIVKTSTAGLVDTYTITYTNGQTTTFTVTNGESITVDSAMSDSSTNPVQNKVITEALALKQDVTDNSLDTEEKTIVGAINEHEGDIDSLKSGLTDLTDHVDGDATTYPYADVITINDAVPANLADCSVKIEPVQDLHGYDKPWVGGAGKNKAPMVLADIKAANTTGTWNGNVYTINQGTITVSVDDADNIIGFVVNGTFTRESPISIFNGTFPVGSYKITGGIHNGLAFGLRDNTGTSVWSTGTEKSYNLSEDKENCDMRILIGADTFNNVNVYPMIRLSTETDATFAPYTNICPISGHTETVVTVADDDTDPTVENTYTLALGDTIYGGTVDFETGVMTVTHKVVDLGNYTWQKTSNPNFYTNGITDFKRITTGVMRYATECICDKYIIKGNGSTITGTRLELYYNTDYSDYRCFVHSDPNVTNMTTTQFKAYIAGTHICYELATSFTVQLTPKQIQLLKGTNTLTASTGQISVTVNGVSGSIGAVQEQVNGHEERIEAVESGLIDVNDKFNGVSFSLTKGDTPVTGVTGHNIGALCMLAINGAVVSNGNIGETPSAYKPSTQQQGACIVNISGNNYNGMIQVNNTGVVYIRYFSDGQASSAAPDNTTVYGNITWAV